jgi:hypothetical protein
MITLRNISSVELQPGFLFVASNEVNTMKSRPPLQMNRHNITHAERLKRVKAEAWLACAPHQNNEMKSVKPQAVTELHKLDEPTEQYQLRAELELLSLILCLHGFC